MQEIIAVLAEGAKQLRDAEAMQSFKTITRGLAAKIYLAHGAISLAQDKLLQLEDEEEETCEKP